jgi:c-di-GMP phosphodiesterase
MDNFIARQPIFDRDLRIVGYELRYRPQAVGAAVAADHQGAGGSSLDAIAGVGVDQFTGGSTAFVSADWDSLHSGVLDLLPADHVVLEIQGLEPVHDLDQVVDFCHDLQTRGFRIAVDAGTSFPALLGVADIIRVDVAAFGPDRSLEAARALGEGGGQLLASRVKSEGMYELCQAAGFMIFQGPHFMRPRDTSRKEMTTESVSVLRLLSLLREEKTSNAHILDVFRSAPALSFKLLRLVNSAALGGRGIESIEYAVRLLGRQPLYRWLSMLLVRNQGEGDAIRQELIHSSLLRARMCELVGEAAGNTFARNLPDRGILFLVGLFSHMDLLMGAPLQEIADQVDMGPVGRAALLERSGPGGQILEAIEAYQDADWDRAEEILEQAGGDPRTLGDAYLDAVTWARSRMSLHEE